MKKLLVIIPVLAAAVLLAGCEGIYPDANTPKVAVGDPLPTVTTVPASSAATPAPATKKVKPKPAPNPPAGGDVQLTDHENQGSTYVSTYTIINHTSKKSDYVLKLDLMYAEADCPGGLGAYDKSDFPLKPSDMLETDPKKAAKDAAELNAQVALDLKVRAHMSAKQKVLEVLPGQTVTGTVTLYPIGGSNSPCLPYNAYAHLASITRTTSKD